MERDDEVADQCVEKLNFNSHAHVERDSKGITAAAEKGISTHTLTWSVTEQGLICKSVTCISTHTLTWSVTIFAIVRLHPPYISTHTLTWSVTHK